eukprot:TRINITY_DN2504_c1_g1_i1.p1 TRINITY_DN2504_c1_g1~~TRINITY_DN2504_c1_g1_i1.p1  ORF type:complete len:479 (+),score=81.44 TRINITY_DN2504_c1_g1_i1:39-1439(+)
MYPLKRASSSTPGHRAPREPAAVGDPFAFRVSRPVRLSKPDSLDRIRAVNSIESWEDFREYFSRYHRVTFRVDSAVVEAFMTYRASGGPAFEQILKILKGHILRTTKTFAKFQGHLPVCTFGAVHISVEEAAALLAMMFFGLVEGFNFNDVLASTSRNKAECVKCLFAYFESLSLGHLHEARGIVFRKVCYGEPRPGPELLQPIKVVSTGKLEDAPEAAIADFANKKLGGGVLGPNGCVQEEILFITHPECIIGMLLCDDLKDDEAVVITGCRRFAEYSGYKETFTFTGMSKHGIPTEIAAMDALDRRGDQYSEKNTKRELVKCYTACKGTSRRSFATGNWGCGAFGGDPYYKAVLQWVAVSMAGKHMVYHTHGDINLSKYLQHLSDTYQGTRAEDVWQLLIHPGRDKYLRGGTVWGKVTDVCMTQVLDSVGAKPKTFSKTPHSTLAAGMPSVKPSRGTTYGGFSY